MILVHPHNRAMVFISLSLLEECCLGLSSALSLVVAVVVVNALPFFPFFPLSSASLILTPQSSPACGLSCVLYSWPCLCMYDHVHPCPCQVIVHRAVSDRIGRKGEAHFQFESLFWLFLPSPSSLLPFFPSSLSSRLFHILFFCFTAVKCAYLVSWLTYER